MPELPEVETIKRGLNKFILRQKITKITVKCDKSFCGPTKEAENHIITTLRRFGKALIYDPSSKSDRYAAGHPSDNFTAALPNKQTRVIITLTHGTLYFNDQRKFGFIKVLPTAEVASDPFIRKLAKEPWDMTPAELYDKLQRHPNSCIKATILDQSIICGLGNIYADEALFAARIHPERKSGTITEQEAALFLESARAVMDKSIASGGSTMKTYVKADGTKGDYLDFFAQVFRRQGQPCPRCQAKIQKIKVAGRGTHICPHCQPKEPISRKESKDA